MAPCPIHKAKFSEGKITKGMSTFVPEFPKLLVNEEPNSKSIKSGIKVVTSQ